MPTSPSDRPDGAPPPEVIRRLNTRMVMRLLGAAPDPVAEGGFALRVVQTRGRRTGRPRRTPVGVTQRGGHWYLVSPNPRRDWVRNLAADPACRLLAGEDRQDRHATPIGGAEAAEAVATYLSVVPESAALWAFPFPAGASTTEIAAHLDTIAVFRLDPPEGAAGGDQA